MALRIDSETRRRMEEFTSEYLKLEYRPRAGRRVRGPKVIHLNKWGTQRFYQWEIAAIDTPLVQRLRQIKQTGLSAFTFPSSIHTRFDHSLGVVEQATRLLNALIEQYKHDQGLKLPGYLYDVRFAALIHDIGQCAFSHTSEEVYRYLPDMWTLIKADNSPFPSTAPHEVFSYLITETTAFQEFVDELQRDYNVTLSLDSIRKWIINRPLKEERHISSIISGPFDADKLDYITRDGLFSGLPLSLDLDRLFYSLEIKDLLKKHLPDPKREQWVKNITDDGRRLLTVGINSVSPLEQIIFAKTMLTACIYQHHKVRAGDCMVKAVIEYVKNWSGSPLKVGKKELRFEHATDFLWLTDESFLEAAQTCRDPVLHAIIHDIRYRRFYVRALALCKDTLEKKSRDEDFNRIFELQENTPQGERRRRQLAKLICRRANKKGCDVKQYQIWIDLPKTPLIREGDEQYVHVPAENRANEYTLWPLSQLWPVQKWADQFRNHRWAGHVFCPPEYVTDVADAAKEVLELELKVKFNYLAKRLCHLEN